MSNFDPSVPQQDWSGQFTYRPQRDQVPSYDQNGNTMRGTAAQSRPPAQLRGNGHYGNYVDEHSTQPSQRFSSDANSRGPMLDMSNGSQVMSRDTYASDTQLKDEDDELLDDCVDEEVMDGGNINSQPQDPQPQDPQPQDLQPQDLQTQDSQTTAERVAQRRKMKRFRLTHQQTRYLMSEFAKQPHPDAHHREFLSRHIPGLSPRQVQVWFQNRRAKIKRLNADDRTRLLKMRELPEHFDNIQALHSPYGAVHHVGVPTLSSPINFAPNNYGSSTMDMQGRPHIRGLQPLQLPGALNRSRAESMMSPLRTSMSWTGEPIDGNYSNQSRMPPGFNSDSPATAAHPGHSAPFESNNPAATYASNSMNSPSYTATLPPPPVMHTGPDSNSILRPPTPGTTRHLHSNTTSRLPLGLDMRGQFHHPSINAIASSGSNSQQLHLMSASSPLQSAARGYPNIATATSTPTVSTNAGGAAAFTNHASYPGTPMNLSMGQGVTAGLPVATSTGYPAAQLSASLPPNGDFGQGYPSLTSTGSRTPMRDNLAGVSPATAWPVTRPSSGGDVHGRSKAGR